MATIHNEANIGDIAKTVIMCGDPRRAKRIAEKYLENPRLVNDVREAYAYTGTYKGKELTVMAHGMGIPSMGIYAYELFKVYDVDRIIRVGTSGTFTKDINVLDIVLVSNSYSESNFTYELCNEKINFVPASKELNKIIEDKAREMNIKITKSNVLCNDCFDYYVFEKDALFNRLPKDLNLNVAEMESFSLFYLAYKFKKQASCLVTVADSHVERKVLTPDQREESLDRMTLLALESI